MASSIRRAVFFNDQVKPIVVPASNPGNAPLKFHRDLPGYKPTKLVPVDAVAKEIGVKSVLVKLEGERFGLQSFKILGASRGTYNAIVKKVGLRLESSLADVKAALKAAPTTLFAATDGNHGAAVAHMGTLLGVPAEIFVPAGLHASALEAIKSEGGVITQINASYDEAVQAAFKASKETNGILIQDTAFPGYEEIPTWVVEGYSAMHLEIEEQLAGVNPNLVIAPIGVGSFGQSVVSHFKSEGKDAKVLVVEPDTAPCLYESLVAGEAKAIETTPTIMAGLDCGTVSSLAWPILKAGVEASATVSDYEAHEACKLLQSLGLSAGPCGAAALAALRRLNGPDKTKLGLDESSTVLLFCTEGEKEYDVPRDVSIEDTLSLTQTLVQINSAVPGTGAGDFSGAGETEVARYLAAWFAHRDIETHWLERTAERPSVVAVVRGTKPHTKGKNLMFNGHIDTVTIAGYDGDPLSGLIQDGKLYGRGAADMKCGVATIMVALARAKAEPLEGDVIFTAVADEEDLSIGTEQVLEASWRADAAMVCEPTLTDLVIGHKGFVWFEVTIHGLAAHRPTARGSILASMPYRRRDTSWWSWISTPRSWSRGPGTRRWEVGACTRPLSRAGRSRLRIRPSAPSPSSGGRMLGRRWSKVTGEIEGLLKMAAQNSPGLNYELKVSFARNAFGISKDHPFVAVVADEYKAVAGKEIQLRKEAFWTDCALIADKGIPVVMFGPWGEGLHAKKEWVEIDSLDVVANTLIRVSKSFCGEAKARL